MYIAMLGALLVIMSLFILIPCYINKPLFNKAFTVFVFFAIWYLFYAITMLFDLNYSVILAAVAAGVLAYGFNFLRKSKKIALLNRFFAE